GTLDERNIGREHEAVCLELLGEHGRGEILVDDRFHALEPVPGADDRHPAAAGTDDDRAACDQCLDRCELDDPERLGRRDDAAEAVAVPCDRPAPLVREPTRFALLVHRPDRLRRRGEARIQCRDEHARRDRHDLAFRQFVLQRVGEEVADHALRLGNEHVERVRSDVAVGLAFEREQSDLRAVAVRDHELVVGCGRGERGGGGEDVAPLDLRLRRLAAAKQRVAAECDDDALPHRSIPRVSISSTASSVGRRFADCSHTADCGPSMTAAATSSPRFAGRQCRKIAPGCASAISCSVTWNGASAFARASCSDSSPIEAQTSAYTAWAPATASRGSWTTCSSVPVSSAAARARWSTSGSGAYSAGQATVTLTPVRAPASSSEWTTLLPPSPQKATCLASRSPNASRIVRRSASAWHG